MKIVILSDKKPGHYKQSLGIVQKMPECNSEWIDIQFKNKSRDNLLRIVMCVLGGIPLPSNFTRVLLKWSLDSTSYNSVFLLQEADLILSTGSSVASVNLLLGKLLDAKTVTCLRPSPVGTRYFDLAILPMPNWKRRKKQRNICKTIGIPNPIYPNILNAEREILISALKLNSHKRIGLLIGGTDKHETISMKDARKLFEFCQEAANNQNLQILMTTSRRTPHEVTNYLKEWLESEDWCPLYADPDTPSEINDPYQAILALSDLLIVSADSFSMVCEAASSGKKVFVLKFTQKTGHLPKRYKAYQYMQDNSIITMGTLQDLQQYITHAELFDGSSCQLEDTNKVIKRIQNIMAENMKK